MKKSDLKRLIKPIVKECIHEALIEEGILSNVVSEVLKGMQPAPLVENIQRTQEGPFEKHIPKKAASTPTTGRQIAEYRKKMADAVGKNAYNGVNLFEGTEPLASHAPPRGKADLGDPGDAGVDISSILGESAAIWQAMK